ncbi:MAG TPA: FAD-binding oxidoreductase [Candidatus Paceibacterota bacterium]
MEEFLSNDPETLKNYSHDASLFEMKPKWVATPRNAEDIKSLVKFALEKGETLTPRAGGSDMTGGPLSESIVVDVAKLNKIGEIREEGTQVEPGVFYRDFESKTLENNLLLPCYPASKNMAAIGGMVGNNCGGEKSLRYGKMEDFIVSSKWVFADGNEYTVSRAVLDNPYSEQVLKLIKENEQIIRNAKPKVSKNSSGYYLWNVYPEPVEGLERIFDLNKLLVGSQGTLGIMTEATLRLVPTKPYHDLVVLFFKSWDQLPPVVDKILPFEPEDLETFDKATIKMGLRLMPFTFATQFLSEAVIGVEMLGFPELVVLVEIAGENENEVKRKVRGVVDAIKPFEVWHQVVEQDAKEEKFWKVRRESFNLLRKEMGGKKTAPFVDDFCVPVEAVPAFLPKAKVILEKHDIHVNIAGHAGNGNFHIIPLMDLRQESEREKLIPVAEAFYDLVRDYKGTISGEHNDGLVRTPFLGKMYSPEVLELFKKVKQIFDPEGIFNPKKKVGATIEDFKKYLTKYP